MSVSPLSLLIRSCFRNSCNHWSLISWIRTYVAMRDQNVRARMCRGLRPAKCCPCSGFSYAQLSKLENHSKNSYLASAYALLCLVYMLFPKLKICCVENVLRARVLGWCLLSFDAGSWACSYTKFGSPHPIKNKVYFLHAIYIKYSLFAHNRIKITCTKYYLLFVWEEPEPSFSTKIQHKNNSKNFCKTQRIILFARISPHPCLLCWMQSFLWWPGCSSRGTTGTELMFASRPPAHRFILHRFPPRRLVGGRKQ